MDDYIEEDFCYENDLVNAGDFDKENAFEILKSDDIIKQRDRSIKEAMEYICLDREETVLACLNFQWNIEILKEKWYEDVELNRIRCGIDMSVKAIKELQSQGIIPNNKECMVCFSPRDNTFFALKCNHYFCRDCWTEYIESKEEDINTILGSSCMQKGCNLIITESVFKMFMKPKMLDVYYRSLAKNFTDFNTNIKWCPNPHCGSCIKSSVHSGKEIICECGSVFCFSCGKDSHRPCDCHMVEVWELKGKSESENVKWLTANTKQCPMCRKYIEKNQGCNHITCSKAAGGCGYDFCWVCLGPSIHDGGEHNFKCNRFDPKKIANENEKARDAAFELEKYVFYYDRFINHEKGIKFANGLVDKIKTVSYILETEKGICYEDYKCLQDAIDTIIRSRRILKNTYIFGYYLLQAAKEKPLFEHGQFLLEQNTDKLHELLEKDYLNNLFDLDITFNVEWKAFRFRLINQMCAINKYQDNLLDDIEFKLVGSIDFNLLK